MTIKWKCPKCDSTNLILVESGFIADEMESYECNDCGADLSVSYTVTVESIEVNE